MSSGLRVGRHAHIKRTLASASVQFIIGVRVSVIDVDEHRFRGIWVGENVRT